MRATPAAARMILAAAFCLAAAACAPAARAQQYCCEEADPPSYPHEPHFVLARRTSEQTSESSFKLSDGDVIRVRRRPTAWRPTRTESELPPLLIRFVLNTGPEVEWWKGLTVYRHESPGPQHPRGRWLKVRHVSVNHSNSYAGSVDVHVKDLRGGVVLVFEKAKALGAHTPMHGMLLTEADSHLAGETIYFEWQKDR